MLRTAGLACVRSTRFLVGPSRLSAAQLLTSSRTSQRPGWGAAGSSRGLCAAPEASPKIQALVDQISGLTLLEASELTDALKEKLGIVTPSRWAKFCGSNHEGVTPYAAGAYKSYTKQPPNHGANLEQRRLSADNSIEGERERMRIS